MVPKGYGASQHSLLASQLFEAVEERSLQSVYQGICCPNRPVIIGTSIILFCFISFLRNRDIWRLLDHHNADPNIIIPGKGISPFHLVIGCECSHFAEEATRTFLQHNGNPNIQYVETFKCALQCVIF